MDTLKKNTADLVKVKTLVTLALTGVFCVCVLRGTISGESFLNLYLMVLSFYFGTQYGKAKQNTTT